MISAVLVIYLGWWTTQNAGAQSGADDVACRAAASPTWTAQEVWVWERLCSGTVADLNATAQFGGATDPDTPSTWTDQRVLRPRFLRSILLEEPYHAQLANKQVSIYGAWFNETLDLADSHITSTVFLEGCLFDAPVLFQGTEIEGRLSFDESTLNHNLDLNQASLDGSLFLRDGATFRYVDLPGSQIRGVIDATRSTFNDDLGVSGSRVTGSVFLRESTFEQVNCTSPIVNWTFALLQFHGPSAGISICT